MTDLTNVLNLNISDAQQKRIEEVDELVHKARQKAFSQYAYNHFMVKFSDQEYIDSLNASDPGTDWRMGSYLQKWADEQPEPKWFSCLMTVNCKDGVAMPDFVKAVDKFLVRKFIKSYKMAYEQKEYIPELPFKGYHAHIIIYRDEQADLTMSKLKKYAKNTFKHICSVEQSTCLNFKQTNLKGTPNFIKYITGAKVDIADKHKPEKQAKDILFREQYQLSRLYEKIYIPPVISGEPSEPPGDASDDEVEDT